LLCCKRRYQIAKPRDQIVPERNRVEVRVMVKFSRLMEACLFLAVIALGAGSTAAQEAGRIEGQVRGIDDQAVSGVTVMIREIPAVDISDRNGRYAFPGVPPGSYTMTFTLGNNSVTEEGVAITSGLTATVNMKVEWDIGYAETITIYSASRRVERVVDAPAAVTVVTEQEIERQASHGQLPKLLEFTPGAEVTQSGLYDYNFNTRGFNSSLNRRVATLIDGRDPSVPFLGAQEWAAVSFPLDDLASLELVRGPSAALYGANASSGVLNMVTRAPRYSQGGTLRLSAGELSSRNVDFRWAGELSESWYMKVTAGLRDSGDFTRSRNGAAEYSRPCTSSADIDCLPQEATPLTLVSDDNIVFGSVRADKYFSDSSLLTLEAGIADLEGPTFQTGIGRVQLVDVERPWARVPGTTTPATTGTSWPTTTTATPRPS
jgi:outer membrane receptor protein involved in Fe transport